MSDLPHAPEDLELARPPHLTPRPVDLSMHPVLARLIDEVRIEHPAGPQAYNRTHNRHNRTR
ncbi:hypothetical protein tb265_49900 [Gemmatimonadetes bacterium T265]|nr:hypothetical protein tb265_49900 [Gemmatimonadetes bacterium T265]